LIYKNEKYGESKVYTVAENWAGTWHIKEYVNQCRKSEMTISKEEVASFIHKLELGGWVKKDRLSSK
tara:strand:- start:617 stop:817 length:201 start_codon:yes stop_codon:yes gene_type:complete